MTLRRFRGILSLHFDVYVIVTMCFFVIAHSLEKDDFSTSFWHQNSITKFKSDLVCHANHSYAKHSMGSRELQSVENITNQSIEKKTLENLSTTNTHSNISKKNDSSNQMFCFMSEWSFNTSKKRAQVNVFRSIKSIKEPLLSRQNDHLLVLVFMNSKIQWKGLSNTTRISDLLQVAMEDAMLALSQGSELFIKERITEMPWLNRTVFEVIEFCVLDVNHTLFTMNTVEKYFTTLSYRVPGIALIPPTSVIFTKLATIYQMFGCPFLTPVSLPHEAFVETFPNVISFAPLSTHQAHALVDFCLLMSWRRVVVVGTLALESVYLTNAFIQLGISKRLSIHTLRGNFGLQSETHQLKCDAAISEVETLSQSLAAALSVLDYSIFVFTVDTLCFSHVLTAIQSAMLHTKSKVALLFSDAAVTLFPKAQEYLYGTQKGQHVFESSTEGWFFVLPGSPTTWNSGNMALTHRLYMDASRLMFTSLTSQTFGYYELLFYDVIRAVSENVILQFPFFKKLHCLPLHTFVPEYVIQLRQPTFVEQDFLNLQYQILHNQRTVYDSYCFYKSTETSNDSAFLRFRRPPNNSSTNAWLIFDSLMGSIIITPNGTDLPRFCFFNVGPWRNNTNGTLDLDALPVAVWDSPSTVANSTTLPNGNTLARYLTFLNNYVMTRFPGGYLHENLQLYEEGSKKNISTLVSNFLNDKRKPKHLYFPQSHMIPKDCLFCDKKPTVHILTYCRICEEDRIQIYALLLFLMRHNPNLFQHKSFLRNDTTLAPASRPTDRSLCELWPLIIRCSSATTYVLYLEGLDLQGPLPTNIGHLKHVEELRFSRNYFEGPLPSVSPFLCRQGLPALPSLVNALTPTANTQTNVNKLKKIYFSRNLLNGTIPDDWQYCSGLRVLYINRNQIQGHVPTSLCQLELLTDVDMSNNQLTGSLPNCITNAIEQTNSTLVGTGWSSLVHFNIENNELQGGIPESYKKFNRLITLKLKNNQLSGLIPDIWDEMPPGFSLDILENSYLKPPLPPSLIRRILFRPEHIFLDSFLYECPSGFVAPTVNSHTNFLFGKKKNITSLPITNLSQFCIPCAKGTRVSENGRECTPCSPGTIAPTDASSHCIKCGPGTYSTKGDDHCLLCQPGEYSYLETSAMCHPCPANHYMEYYGASYCLACPDGSNCTTVEQKAFLEASRGWYRIATHSSLNKTITIKESLRGPFHLNSFVNKPRRLDSMSPTNLSLLPLASSFSSQYNESQIQKQLGLFRCPKPSRCTGKNTCSPLSSGPFCHRCIKGYRNVAWKSECQLCPKGLWTWINFLIPAVLGFFVLILLTRTIRRSTCNATCMSDPTKNLVGSFNKHNAVIFKVFTSWIELNCQALVYATQASIGDDGYLGSNVSSRVEKIYDFIQNLDDPFFLLLPLECILPDGAPEPLHTGLLLGLAVPPSLFLVVLVYQYRFIWYHFFVHTLSRLFRQKSFSKLQHKIIASVSPQKMLQVSWYKSFCDTILFTKKNFETPWDNSISIFTVVFFLIHPAITRQFLKNLNCIDVDKPRVKQNYALICTMLPHIRYIQLAWGGLLAWSFGLPLIFVATLYYHRDNLHNPQVTARWGFLLDGYESRYYWWEIWAMLRKVLMDIPSIIPSLNENLQQVALLTLAIIALVAHVSAEPFDNRFYKAADHMETYNMWTLILTLLTIPIHEDLNLARNCYYCQFFSKFLLTFNVLICLVSPIWCLLFFTRPLVLSFLHNKISYYNSQHGLENNFFTNSLHSKFRPRHNIFAQSSKSKILCQSQSQPDSKSCSFQESFSDQHSLYSEVELPLQQTIKENYKDTSSNHKILFHSCWKKTQTHDTTRSYFHQFLYTISITRLGQILLRFHPAKVYLRFPDHSLDISQLNYNEKKYFQDVVIQELINAQFLLHPDILDCHFVCETLARIFRCKAFSVRVQYVKTMIRCAESKNFKECQPFHWCRSFSKETTISLKPLLSGFQALKYKYWSHPLLTDPNKSATSTYKHDNNVEDQTVANHPLQLPGVRSILPYRDPFTGLPYTAATTQVTPNDNVVKPLTHQNTVSSSNTSLTKYDTHPISVFHSFNDSFSKIHSKKSLPSTGAQDPQFYQRLWKQTKRKIVYSCQFIHALKNVSQELDEESTHYGWTIEELQECLHQLSTSMNRQRHASILNSSSS